MKRYLPSLYGDHWWEPVRQTDGLVEWKIIAVGAVSERSRALKEASR